MHKICLRFLKFHLRRPRITLRPIPTDAFTAVPGCRLHLVR
ncbi:hypothetical protein RSSM_06855 [Rhodopirellula sallentina SM41]|uniref:Uncharacterized protein n=1 Tax=Rhodopirellula sallentina SM41 TaxID=1263870 RepID=M5U700_9BACT|nr:hypothetical protein RSSM_06855 [Rhodopirellula sallentina SM41]